MRDEGGDDVDIIGGFLQELKTNILDACFEYNDAFGGTYGTGDKAPFRCVGALFAFVVEGI